MYQKNKIVQAVAPFLALAVVILVAIIGFVLLSYLLIFAALFGLIIYLVTVVRLYFFKRELKKAGKQAPDQQPTITRIIDVQYTKRDEE